MKISVVIPVYKKTEMFLRHLRHNMQFFNGYEIIVVDDASEENISQRLKEEFPEVIVLVNKENKGFSPTVNRGLEFAHGDIVLLLNSDVRIKKKLPQHLFNSFDEDPELFAISGKQEERDGKYVGKNRIYFKTGFLRHSKQTPMTNGINGWAEAGSCLLRLSMYKMLGGLREFYAPFYWEDIDLSYRAYSQGWHVLFDEDLLVEHHHESTVATYFKRRFIKSIAYRNQLLCIWSNITDKNLCIQHLFFLPRYLLIALIRGDMAFISGFLRALPYIPQALHARASKRRHAKLSDREILDFISRRKEG